MILDTVTQPDYRVVINSVQTHILPKVTVIILTHLKAPIVLTGDD